MALGLSINLDHLDRLSQRIVVNGTPMLATAIYAEAPSYAPVGAPGEGIACVDDVARAAIVYLDEHARTGSTHALDQAREALEFTMRMQEPDGRFVNFITDLDGTQNRTGTTSRPELGWWAMRGMWALAHGVRSFERRDPAFAARLMAGYERTESALAELVASPGWIQTLSPDCASVGAIAMADMVETHPTARTKSLLGAVATGVASVGIRAGRDGVFSHAGHTAAAPGMWHAWGAHESEALARAGQLLDRPDLIDAARADVEGLAAWQLAAGRIHELSPGPMREGQQAYGVTTAIRGAMALYRATGEERYARMAGLHASWFAGNNMAHESMYDTATGRGYDGIDAPPRGRNLSSGAESTIEALLGLQAIAGVPAAERYARVLPVGKPLTWVAAAADQLQGGPVEFDVPVTGDYVLLAGAGRNLRRLDGQPIHLERGRVRLDIDTTGISSLVLHPVVARTDLEVDDTRIESRFDMRTGNLEITEHPVR